MTAATSLAALVLAFVTLVTPTMLAAQSTTPTPVPTSPTTPTPGVTPDTGLQIVEVSQSVPAGGSSAALTPPANTTMVVTDMLVTNPNTTPVCGVDLTRGGAAVIGGLCVGAPTTLEFAFTTAVVFSDAAPIRFVNTSAGTEPVRVHLRGVLVPSVTTPTGTTPTGTVTPSG